MAVNDDDLDGDHGDIDDDLDDEAVWAFLHQTPPRTIAALSDRLLLAMSAPERVDVTALLGLYPQAFSFAASPGAVGELTSLAVAVVAYEALDVDVADMRFSLALVCRVHDVDTLVEPFRSTARYWLWRAALRRSFDDPGDDVSTPNPRHAHALHSHRVLFASSYGTTPRAQHDLPGFAGAIAPTEDCGDQHALALLCAASCTPTDAVMVRRLRRSLGQLQMPDGAFHTRSFPADGEVVADAPEARLHAAVVAALALTHLKR
jgi:hypothetical protein